MSKPKIPHHELAKVRREKQLAALHAKLAEGKPVFSGKRFSGGVKPYVARVRLGGAMTNR